MHQLTFRTVFLAVTVILWGMGCSSSEKSTENPGHSGGVESAGTSRIVNVEVSPVSAGDFTDYIRIVGEVQAWQDVTVSAEEIGVIKEFFVNKGAVVREGDPIAKLKDEVLSEQVEEARAVADLAQEQFERQRELWEKEKVGSELAYLQAKSQAGAARARLNMLQARLDNTTVRAPVDGIFDERYLDVGEMASAGSPLGRIVQTDKVKITGGVPERFALSVRPGDIARIWFEILPEREFVGEINFVGTTVNPDTRTFPVEVVLENPQREIKPMMVANLQLVRERLREVIIVPRQAVQRVEGGYMVYVAQENQGVYVAAMRQVEPGSSHGDQVVINKGLTVGELLITVGHQQVDDGSPVRLVDLDAASVGQGE